ncbi:hypothetical protein [Limnobacter sp.]|uniref:hypothetical protein n=1 Tax=Limnobacter sp. TaxID=2003368 RepID=UPI00311EBB6F
MASKLKANLSQIYGWVGEFLKAHPEMAVLPIAGDQVILEGAFKFRINVQNQQTFSDEFELKIAIPNDFPDNLPMVFEIAGRIPIDGNFHVNPGDQSLCLGSPLRLMDLLYRKRTLLGFVEACLVPYLYAVAKHQRGGERFEYGELDHGKAGLMDDYEELFDVCDEDAVIWWLILLTLKKRVANKNRCLFCFNQTIGRCKHKRKLAQLRRLGNRSQYIGHLNSLL